MVKQLKTWWLKRNDRKSFSRRITRLEQDISDLRDRINKIDASVKHLELKGIFNDLDFSSFLTGRTGETIEDAIVIKATDEEKGVSAEYARLSKKYGPKNEGWTLLKQASVSQGNRHYDVLDIKLKDGTQKTIYFDITEFFGKEKS